MQERTGSCRDLFALTGDGDREERSEGDSFIVRKRLPRSSSLDALCAGLQADLRGAGVPPPRARERSDPLPSSPSGGSGAHFLDEAPEQWALPSARCARPTLSIDVPSPPMAPVTPTGMLSPTTSDLLSTYDCELMSPCISVVSAGERGVVARPATIKDGEGIWIRLELTHSMQSLLDSCGNGRLSWLYVAVRLDVANALSVNPRHLKLISLEERPGNKVILQLILMQPPDSTLSLAKVGEVLHEQALAQASLAQARCLEPQSGVDATPKSSPKFLKGPPAVSLTASPSLQSLAQTVLDESEGESTCFWRVPSAVEMPSPAKRLLISTGACGQSMAQRASGVVLKNRKRVVNMLQLVEKVEVKLAPPAKLASGSLRNGVYTALVLLVLTSFTYLASAFGVLPASMPLRSSSSHASSAATLTPNARVGAFAPAPFLLARAPRAVVRTSGGMTQLRMLEPMTLATMALMGASKLTGTVTKIKEAKGNSPPPAAASSADEDRPLLRLINMAQDGV